MKTKLTLISIFISALTFAQNLKPYLVDFQHKDIGQVRMLLYLNFADSTFEANTRQDADIDFLGGNKMKLVRKMSNFKDGSLIRIEKGVCKLENDSLKLSGIFVSPIGNYFFNGNIKNDVLSAELRPKNNSIAGTIKGSLFKGKLPLENYTKLFADAENLIQEKIYNKSLLTTGSYKSFVENTREAASKAQDDLEMVFAFFYNSRKLPTSHLALLKTNGTEDMKKEKNQIVFEEKNATTAYMNIKSFNGSSAEVDSAFTKIYLSNYQSLIIDLRENTGGTIEAGMALSKHLFDSTFFGGVFLTQKWFNRHLNPPLRSDYEKFQSFSAANFDQIISGIHTTEGLCLKIIPNAQTFKGKLYVLTSQKTASTCEPIVYALKQQKKAIIIGKTTAGAMMNGEKFDLWNGFKIYVPTADYYTSDGFRIDQKGVKPDIETKVEESLAYALKN
jgi:Peptidase family S41